MKRGRPKLEADESRTDAIHLRLNKNERMMLEYVSREVGLTKAKILRELLYIAYEVAIEKGDQK